MHASYAFIANANHDLYLPYSNRSVCPSVMDIVRMWKFTEEFPDAVLLIAYRSDVMTSRDTLPLASTSKIRKKLWFSLVILETKLFLKNNQSLRAVHWPSECFSYFPYKVWLRFTYQCKGLASVFAGLNPSLKVGSTVE